jgi:hAT family C-terminal dimerisation region
MDRHDFTPNLYSNLMPISRESRLNYFNLSLFKATSAPSERIFSSASDILTSDRACLAPETVQALSYVLKTLVSLRYYKLKIKIN